MKFKYLSLFFCIVFFWLLQMLQDRRKTNPHGWMPPELLNPLTWQPSL